MDPADLGGTILVLEDVTAAHTFDDLMRRQSQRDPRTGLANRTALLERLDRRVREDGRTGVTVTVINIDGLREINATFGYATGDHVLVHVASRLKTAMGHSDLRRRADRRRRLRRGHRRGEIRAPRSLLNSCSAQSPNRSPSQDSRSW